MSRRSREQFGVGGVTGEMDDEDKMTNTQAIDFLDNLDTVIDFYNKKTDDSNGINLAVTIAVLEVRNALAKAIGEAAR